MELDHSNCSHSLVDNEVHHNSHPHSNIHPPECFHPGLRPVPEADETMEIPFLPDMRDGAASDGHNQIGSFVLATGLAIHSCIEVCGLWAP